MVSHIALQRSAAAPSSICRLSRAFSSTHISSSPDSSSNFKPRSTSASSLLNSIDSTPNRSSFTGRDDPTRQFADRLSKELNKPRDTQERTLNLFQDRLRAKGIERLQTRNWREGDVYSPHDLSPAEMKKWRMRKRPGADVFDRLGVNPEGEWKNYALMSEFTTTMGRIKHPRETGLRPVNQRKIAKAIRRAAGMGFMPSVHVHPEMLRRNGPWKHI